MPEPTPGAMRAAEALYELIDDASTRREFAQIIDRETALPQLVAIAERIVEEVDDDLRCDFGGLIDFVNELRDACIVALAAHEEGKGAAPDPVDELALRLSGLANDLGEIIVDLRVLRRERTAQRSRVIEECIDHLENEAADCNHSALLILKRLRTP